MLYLKIENPGVCPLEGFTVLGASLNSTTGDDRVIAKFGSGLKHGLLTMLRENLNPVCFTDKLRLEFYTRPDEVQDSVTRHTFHRVCVKYAGTYQGKSKTSKQDLGFVLNFGANDWTGIEMGLREFVSNALDVSVRTTGSWFSATVEIVAENQVRAKTGHTRIFIPVIPDVQKFYNEIGKWFLHFSSPHLIGRKILPKANRSESGGACIYRRGVLVREIASFRGDSLFDYNLNDLPIDECRKFDDHAAGFACARALRDADAESLALYFSSFSGEPKWEHGFSPYGLKSDYYDSDEAILQRKTNWDKAFASRGSKAVLVTQEGKPRVENKGYNAVVVPEAVMMAAQEYGLRTFDKVLSQDELEGRNIFPPTKSAVNALDFVWSIVSELQLNNGKEKPKLHTFIKLVDEGSQTNGFVREQEVYINQNIAPDTYLEWHELSDSLIRCMMEEVAHYVTETGDFTRDFQFFLLDVIAGLARKRYELAT